MADLPAVDSLTDLTLVDQPATDRGYVTPSGTRIRARMVKISETAAVAPANGDVQLAPSTINLSLSLAKLNYDLTVAADDQGRFLIMDAHEIIVSDEMMNDATNFQANIDLVLRQQAYELERCLSNRTDVDTYLQAQWGGAASG